MTRLNAFLARHYTDPFYLAFAAVLRYFMEFLDEPEVPLHSDAYVIKCYPVGIPFVTRVVVVFFSPRPTLPKSQKGSLSRIYTIDDCGIVWAGSKQ